MHDRRVVLLRKRAAFHRSEATRLEAEADAAEAARATGVSQWGSELPPLFLLMVLKRLWGHRGTYRAFRATCSTWSSIFDAWCPLTLSPKRWTAAMEGKMHWFQSVTMVDLWRCEEEGISSCLTELRSMPSLHTLKLPASCAERAADAEAVYGLTTVTKLSIRGPRMHYKGDTHPGEWVLDLSRLTMLNTLTFDYCRGLKAEQLHAACSLTGLKELGFDYCFDYCGVPAGLRDVSRLTGLTSLRIRECNNVTTEALRDVSRLTALTCLDLDCNEGMTAEGLLAVASGLTALTRLCLEKCPWDEGVLLAVSRLTTLRLLSIGWNERVTDATLRTLFSLTNLTELYLNNTVDNLTDAGLEALQTALPNLSITYD